jgi:hypothetical protein
MGSVSMSMLAYKFLGSIASHWRKLKTSHYCLKNSKILHTPQISYVHVYHGHVEEEEEDVVPPLVALHSIII